ncbi:hypothetical protein A3C59_03200 [Candidatus Daviesbacteria bacterium RIFCSPHIGHO2_02_FULL_36_13]|uniref:Nudix hydrolase domain-containing protein n=1 Tax=Candidatus Daviesbacteria bacterium RIFCSPHIGHO2_02_FULL_36_13 TaxID=1797768 RepID=A0A1F5JQ34_9BACT|nr:MAG: hypothetical protein A3C59_03200 [Candidatus Daviesbacteria bacterium RIFCSPHIGHO2_02_FULL_36_13]OGE44673.1 MAG: hypothetical protein A3A45_02375 [Candidatus Daviesbacteria bacterium RIFCSPLOWO2_01_FULL_36_8]
MKKPKLISEKIIYEGPSVKVYLAKVEFENGNIVEWDHAHGSDVVVMLPLDSDNNVYLVREWRIAWRDFVLQIPAGGVDATDEEGKLKQVHNELREEISMDAKNIEHLTTTMLAARTKARISIYLARDLYPSEKDPDPDEFLEVVKMPFDEALEMFLSGKVSTTTYTLLAFMLVKQKLDL